MIVGLFLYGLAVVEGTITFIRKWSLGASVWWVNPVQDMGLVWECAALGYPFNCGSKRKVPSVLQLGIQLSKRRLLLRYIYTAALVAYCFVIVACAVFPVALAPASEGSQCPAIFLGLGVLAMEGVILLIMG